MGFRRKLRWLILVLMPLLLFTGCGDLEPDMQDTRTVILNMDFHGKSSSRSSSSVSESELSQYSTHLILALPSREYLTSSYKNFHSSFAQGLMNTADKKVSLEIPLNTQMKIFVFLFKENYSMSELFSRVREVGYYGESQTFSISANTNNLSLGITLIQVPGTDTDGEADTTSPANTIININSNADNATSTSVTLAISASDSVGVTGYYVSESSTTPANNAYGWVSVTSTISYFANVSFTLSSHDNEIKTVYIWFKDSAGNISSPASDTIMAVYYYWKLIARQVDGNGDGSFSSGERFSSNASITFKQNVNDQSQSTFMSVGNLNEINYADTEEKFKFKLVWDGMQVASENIKEVIWTQTSWLTDSTYDVPGFQEIGVSEFSSTDLTDGHRFVGLWKSNNTAKCVFDGDGGGHNYWWNCVGAIGVHEQGGFTGIPGPKQKIASSMHLYIWAPGNL